MSTSYLLYTLSSGIYHFFCSHAIWSSDSERNLCPVIYYLWYRLGSGHEKKQTCSSCASICNCSHINQIHCLWKASRGVLRTTSEKMGNPASEACIWLARLSKWRVAIDLYENSCLWMTSSYLGFFMNAVRIGWSLIHITLYFSSLLQLMLLGTSLWISARNALRWV